MKISLLIISSALMLFSHISFAQKKKNDKNEEVQKEVTKYERANAEYLLIEAQKFFLLEDYPKSQAFLEQSLAVDSKNHAAYFKLAEIHFTLSNTEKGLEAIAKAISILPNNKYYYLLAAQLNKQNNDFASAALSYEQMIENTTDYYDYLLDLVEIYETLRDFKKAINTIDAYGRKYGVNTSLTLQKVNLLLALDDSNSAIILLKELIDEGTDDKALTLEYAHLLANYRSVQLAIDFLTSIDPFVESDLFLMQLYSDVNQQSDANDLMVKGFSNPNVSKEDKVSMIYDLMNQPDLSINEPLLKSLQTKLEDQYPNEAIVLEMTGKLYWELAKVNTAEKLVYLQKSLKSYVKLKDIDPSDFELWNRILEFEYNSENWTMLLEHSNEALDLFPNQGLFYFYNGAASMENGATNEASMAFKQGLKLSTSNSELTSRIMAKEAQILLNDGKVDLGIARFETAVNLENSHPEVFNIYSFELALRKLNMEKAMSLSEHLLSRDRSSPEYVFTRGFVLFQADQFAEGENLLSSTIDADGFLPNSKVLELYGDFLFKMNKPEEGLIQWQKAQLLGEGSNKLEQKIATKSYYE